MTPFFPEFKEKMSSRADIGLLMNARARGDSGLDQKQKISHNWHTIVCVLLEGTRAAGGS